MSIDSMSCQRCQCDLKVHSPGLNEGLSYGVSGKENN